MNKFESSFEYKVIYVFTIDDDKHRGLLKIGDATVETDETITVDKLFPNSSILNQYALKRIRSYTNTAGVTPNLLYTELAVRNIKDDNGNVMLKAFRDHNVHDVLKNSGINRVKLEGTTAREWYKIDLETAKKAIDAVKKGYKNLSNANIKTEKSPIIFRPEQEKAIESTIKVFKNGNKMLWNAKMRFGKTLCALEVVKRIEFKRTIIITHRPVVDEGWYEDFEKIFYSTNDYIYGSKNKGYTVEDLEKTQSKFIYFASIQDLRGSNVVGGKFDKNNEVFNIDWDCIIIDEAHEGTTTALGTEVINLLVKENSEHNTKVLSLSGTPFNILQNYNESDIYTWDYVMEQTAKMEWDIKHCGDSNPYEDLPEMKIYTYDLGKLIGNGKYNEIEDKAFNFREFFRTWTGRPEIDGKVVPADAKIGDFVHENDVKSFLNLITKDDKESNYPYSNKQYRDLFKHTLWMLPGVREARALSKLMKEHPVFGMGFTIVNVAGDGDEEEINEDALKKVKKAINDAGNNGYTITLSCGKLTTGVTIPEWNAVMMLSGSYSTSAAGYLQTIFRVQSPCNKDGKMKTSCYVFDFAPDRTLKMVAEAVTISTKVGKTTESDRESLRNFLNYCPVISIEGTEMKQYSTNKLLQQLKRAYAERAVKNGFDDVSIYNDELLKLDGFQLKEFEELKKIIGASKSSLKTNSIDINNQGFTDEEYEEQEKLQNKPKKERTPEEQQRLDELNEKKKNRQSAISILRGISIRMPLLIYGADVPFNEEITIDKFTNLVDDQSWEEFMPDGVTKDVFDKFSKYYDADIFISAGRKIRNVAKSADEMEPLERVKKIASLFSCFKNPDKETVLTPWRVVNMHMSDCIGGYKFYDDENEYPIEIPKEINQSKVTDEVLKNPNTKVLEINSKTGLYPLYVTYSIYANKCKAYDKSELTFVKKQEIWDETVKNNIFVICKTPMAKLITKRTLEGYRNAKINAHYFEDLINMLQNKPEQFRYKILKKSYWEQEGSGQMKFDAIVGNPPYQEIVGNYTGTVSQANPIYQLFVETATKMTDKYVSMITPSLWMTGGTGLTKFREYMLEENHISVMYDFENSYSVFNNVNIAGGVSYFLWDKNNTGKTKYTYTRKNNKKSTKVVNMALHGTDIFIRDQVANGILSKIGVFDSNFISFMDVVSTISPFAKGQTGVYDKLFYKDKKENSVKMYRYSKNKNDKYAYVDKENIVANQDWIDKDKVFVSKAGELSAKFNGLPFYGEKGTACSETYIVVGPFNNKDICMNVIKYMNTTLYKYLISQIKKTQNAARGVYKYVPMLDFETNKDIDWAASQSEINTELYNKYKLTNEEIKYIEEVVNQ